MAAASTSRFLSVILPPRFAVRDQTCCICAVFHFTMRGMLMPATKKEGSIVLEGMLTASRPSHSELVQWLYTSELQVGPQWRYDTSTKAPNVLYFFFFHFTRLVMRFKLTTRHHHRFVVTAIHFDVKATTSYDNDTLRFCCFCDDRANCRLLM